MKIATYQDIQSFNKPSSLLVISSYPDPKKGIRELNAVAWHARKTLKRVAHRAEKVIILAEKLSPEEPVTYHLDGKNVLVIRLWEKNKPQSLITLFKEIYAFNHIERLLVQFEFNMFGGFAPVLLLPFLIAMLKGMKKKIYFEMHQVVLDIETLAKHINVKNKLMLWAFNIGLHLYYTAIGLLADKMIVFESELKKRLSRLVSNKKIEVVPLAVENRQPLPQKQAKKELGIPQKNLTILVFGFINWYKGSDWIAETISASKAQNITLLLAGGESPTLKEKDHYKEFYARVQKAAGSHKNIIHTGFVPESKVRLYFSAADIVMLPYRVFMSASGPFSLALNYKKPVMISRPLEDYFDTKDMQEALKASGLRKDQLIFDLNRRSFAQKLRFAHNNIQAYKKFSEALAASRNIHTVKKTYRSLFSNVQRAGYRFVAAFR